MELLVSLLECCFGRLNIDILVWLVPLSRRLTTCMSVSLPCIYNDADDGSIGVQREVEACLWSGRVGEVDHTMVPKDCKPDLNVSNCVIMDIGCWY
jgi:hypothetical protein